MKTCDVCGKTDKQLAGDDWPITSVKIGTSVDVIRPQLASRAPLNDGQPWPTFPEVHDSDGYGQCVSCELCNDCIIQVNEYLAKKLRDRFDLIIRA